MTRLIFVSHENHLKNRNTSKSCEYVHYDEPSDGSTAFVEIKKKYKGVVYKRCVDMSYDEVAENRQADVLKYLRQTQASPRVKRSA